MARSAAVTLAASLALSTLLGACGISRPNPKNVVLIVVDTLRADRVDPQLSPALDALAREGVRFDSAYTPAPWTRPAVASIFTGRYPSGHGVHELRQPLPLREETLAERLSAAGFRTGGVISNVLVRAKWGFDQGFDEYREDQAQGAGARTSQAVTEEAIELLETFATGERPFFLYLHYFDPHWMYVSDPESPVGRRVGRLDGTEKLSRLNELGADLSSEEQAFVQELYDGEVRATDAALGDLFRAMRRLDTWDDTLVIVTSDHGEGFFEHGHFGHVEILYDEVVRVPLILRLPGLGSRTITRPVSLVSLTPTILDLVGVPFDREPLQADSLLPELLLEGGTRDVFIEVDYVQSRWKAANETHMKALVRGRFKIVYDRLTEEWELYDLEQDPLESTDVKEREPELFAELKRDLVLWIRVAGAGGKVVPRHLDETQLEMLRGLGYVSDE